MPHEFPFPQGPPPPEIVEAAERNFLPVPWAAAVAWRESEWTFNHITLDDGDTGGTSWGVFQLHDALLDEMMAPWCYMPRKHLLDPAIGSEGGTLVLRFNLWRVLEKYGYVHQDDDGQAQYEQMPGALAKMAPSERIDVLEIATAAFTCGDAGFLYWPTLANFYGVRNRDEMALVKAQYVSDVLCIMEHIERREQ